MSIRSLTRTLLLTLLFALGACKSSSSAHDHDHDGDHSHHHDGAGSQPASQPGSQPSAMVPQVFDEPPAVGTKAKCPVSGDVFVVSEDTERAEHDGKHVVFCCAGCVDKFEANPEKYTSG